jgi:NAD(P)-dependent dehydrogenase (short-subunit alcohol dehydrogenase family)
MARLLDLTGKRVVITGAASGIGAATLDLVLDHGATVHALDVAPVAPTTGPGADGANSNGQHRLSVHHCDLGNQASIDAAIEALPASVDIVMNCAGIPNGPRFSPQEVMRVNWLGLRHLTERLLPRMTAGGAVVHIASTAGRDWATNVAHHKALMAAADYQAGLAWVEANPDVYGDGYAFSKEAVQYYTLWRSVQLLARDIRMNSICPGVTATSIIPDFRAGLGDDLIDHAAAVAGRMARPEEMAPAMLFLADSAASSYINGVNLNIDRGTGAARATDQSDPDTIWSPIDGVAAD